MPDFHHTQLPNGLTLIGEVNPQAASVAIGYFVGTGARDETPELSGCTHFLEHMMFKGTARRDTFAINREFDEMGGANNAYTSHELTVYHAALLPEYLDRAVDLLSDMMRPALRPEDFDAEKQVVLNEIAMYMDMPDADVMDRVMNAYFAGHPLGQSVLGTRESIAALTRDQMAGYFERRYGAANITVAATGRFDFARWVETVRATTAHWQRGDSRRDRPPHVRGPSSLQCVARDPAKVSREHLAMMCAGPAAHDPLRYAAEILATIIGDRTGSRFYWAMVDKGLVEDASMGYSGLDHAGAFTFYINAAPNKAAEAFATARGILQDVQTAGVTANELEQARVKHASAEVIAAETPRGRLFALGSSWVTLGEYRTLPQELAAIEAVTLADIAAVLDRRPFDDLTTVALGPLAQLEVA